MTQKVPHRSNVFTTSPAIIISQHRQDDQSVVVSVPEACSLDCMILYYTIAIVTNICLMVLAFHFMKNGVTIMWMIAGKNIFCLCLTEHFQCKDCCNSKIYYAVWLVSFRECLIAGLNINLWYHNVLKCKSKWNLLLQAIKI